MNPGFRIGGARKGPALVFELDPYERVRLFRIRWEWMSTIRKGWLEVQVRRLIVRLIPSNLPSGR